MDLPAAFLDDARVEAGSVDGSLGTVRRCLVAGHEIDGLRDGALAVDVVGKTTGSIFSSR